MIYELLFPLRHEAAWLGWLNVLRYVPFRIIAATMTAMLLSFLLAPWFIRELQKQGYRHLSVDDLVHYRIFAGSLPASARRR